MGAKAKQEWNPRYLAYAYAHGETDPKKMLARDAKKYPGGKMCGFIPWIQEKWREWRAIRNIPADAILGNEMHKDFDAWLTASIQQN